MKKVSVLWLAAMLVSSCMENNVYKGEKEEEENPSTVTTEQELGGAEYAKQFDNHRDITVNITAAREGTVYSLYYDYPYEEGELVLEPNLTGKTPIRQTLRVPTHVQKLYIVGNGKVITTDVKDLDINDDTPASTRSTDLSEDVLFEINNVYFPEMRYNVRGEDLYNCSDIAVAETESTEPFEEADVWATYVSDGGYYSNQNAHYGKMWFYTYPSEKADRLTIDDCTFYGMENGEVREISYRDLIAEDDADMDDDNYIFFSKTENDNVKKYGKHTEIYLGRFKKGLNIGFVFHATDRPQFTTPALDKSEQTDKGDWRYIGQTLNYDTGDFKIEKNVSNGFSQHIKVGDFEGNVVGMENRSPNHKAYDGDYNDMLFLLRSNPRGLKPWQLIEHWPSILDRSLAEGYYIFEDNYPDEGDFDFNDVVVKYKIKTYLSGISVVYAKLMAYGCDFNNEFGFVVNGQYKPFFTGIRGYVNVNGTVSEAGLREHIEIFENVSGEILPYLNNGKGYIEEGTFDTATYPYVMDIPYAANADFRWCKEGKPISKAYPFATTATRSGGWYITPLDESLLVTRE